MFGAITDKGRIIDGHITFDSGKKIILTAAEIEEVKAKVRIWKAEARLRLELELMESLESLTLLLDWFNQAPIKELEAVEDAIGFNFPQSELLNALHIILKENQSEIQKKSFERIRKEESKI